MSRSLETHVSPELLIWARETGGFSIEEAAKKIGVPPARLEQVESGAAGCHLTFSQLKSAAAAYRRPVAAFFLPAPPPERRQPLHDFRLHQHAMVGYSPRLNFEIRSAQGHRADIIELAADVGDELKKFDWTLARHTPAHIAAAMIRGMIDIDVAEQLRWKSPETALKAFKAAIERLGVLVFETSNIPLDEMRGFSIPAVQLPVIVLNGGDSHSGRVFTLFHELTHLLLHEAGVCDLYMPEESQSPDAALESYCNAVAAEFLVPEAELRNLAPGNGVTYWDEEALSSLARAFSVSREVVLRRLLTIGRASRDLYVQKREQYRLEFERSKVAQRQKDKGAGPSPSVMAVRNLGQPFVRIVFEAYNQEKISLAKVSDYLGVKVKHLNRIGQLVGSKGA